MNLAFYYHIPLGVNESGEYFLPSYLGVFVDALASEVRTLTLVMHSSNSANLGDYRLRASNISWVNLGVKSPAWHRVFFYNSILKSRISIINDCDFFLIRSPSPLAIYFQNYFDKRKIVYMIVGDYSESVINFKVKNVRHFLIKMLLKYVNRSFERNLSGSKILVNSSALYTKYSSLSKSVQQIRTTTLRDVDFYLREDTCETSVVNLIYTGRIDVQKGIFELIEALYILRQNGFDVRLNIVGWVEDKKQKAILNLKAVIAKKGIEAYVYFHGKKSVGIELNQMYRLSDIFVLSSYHEGFPRTIWEAMANCVPVIATNVGSIPFFLENESNCILIPPKNINAISDAIERIIGDSGLRQNLIRRGYKLAQENTLKIQTNKLIKLL